MNRVSNMLWFGLIRILLASSLVSSAALAQDTMDDFGAAVGEEDLLFGDIPSVFSASKYEQKVTEAPARISIVTADEIRRYGYRNFLDIINSLPGFQTTFDRNYSYVGVRGFSITADYNTRILLLIDGHRMNENIYDGAVLDAGFAVDIDLIDRVEVVRGPASSLYGSSAYFGVINVITKRGRDLEGTEVSAALGSQNSRQGRLSYGTREENGLEVLISGSAYNSDGNDELYYAEFDDPSTNNGIAKNNDTAENRNLFVKLAYRDFTLTGVYEKYTKQIPTGSYDAIFNDPRTQTIEGHAFINLNYARLTDSGTDVTAKLFYDDYWYIGDWVYDYAAAGDPPDEIVFDDDASGKWWGFEVLMMQQWMETHRVSIGTEYRSSLSEKQLEKDIYDVYLDVTTDSVIWAAFIQDEIQLRDDLIVNLGLRYDNYSTFGSTTNPRLAAIWKVQQNSTLKFLYGKAFRAPNAYELYYHDGDITQKQSENLQPETIESFEMIGEHQLGAKLNLVVSLFQNNVEQLLSLVTDPADDLLVIKNVGTATARGAELELQGHWENGLKGALSYTYQLTEDEQSIRLANSALNMLKLNLITPFAGDSFSISVDMQYESGRKTLGGDTTENRMLTNLTLFSANWIDNMKLSASVYNAFDKKYAVPGSEEHVQDKISQDGRIFRVKLDYTF
jgi:iron complex outermembrane receptor protein